ncbi:MAG: DUF2490 domain-containing protein [Nitritalea sp.]
MRLRPFLLTVCLLLGFVGMHFPKAQAQREVNFIPELWGGFMTSGQIAPRVSIWMDTHFVPELFLIGRGGLTFHSADQKWSFTAGYAALMLRTGFSDGRLVRPEHRPWGQIVYRLPPAGPFTSSLRYRHDMRYRALLDGTEILDEFQLNHRLRANFSMRYNFGRRLSPHFNTSISLLNESLWTVGPAFADNPYEHRIWPMLNIQHRAVTFSPGYHFRLSFPNPETLNVRSGFFLWVTINYDWRNFKRHFLREFPTDHM